MELDLTPKNSPREDIVSVSRLLRSARDLIERRFPLLWVSGEICDVKPARSGHLYFVLKDEQAQVDWASFGKIRIGNATRNLSCFVMVLSFSRAHFARFVLDQKMESFLSTHSRLPRVNQNWTPQAA